MNKGKTKEQTKYYCYCLCLFILCVVSFIAYYICNFYPKWGNGQKVLHTKANVIETFYDETSKQTYSHLEYYDNHKNYHHKWFQISLNKKDKPTIYYAENQPLEKSRLTNPSNSTLCFFLLIFTCIIFIFVLVILKKSQKTRRDKDVKK